MDYKLTFYKKNLKIFLTTFPLEVLYYLSSTFLYKTSGIIYKKFTKLVGYTGLMYKKGQYKPKIPNWNEPSDYRHL